ncbi:MAG: response regulator [Deltaproteobacteria bacterium]|nr:response regulator [Deltaproteobacteria bacterium]
MSSTILVVDDDNTVRSLLQEVFEAEGWAVKTAADGMEALVALKMGRFDLMVTDLHMPRLDGYKLIPHALNTSPEMSILVLSADSSISSIGEIYRHAIKGFLPKPFKDVRVVLEKTRQALELSRSHKSLAEKLARAEAAIAQVSSGDDD